MARTANDESEARFDMAHDLGAGMRQHVQRAIAGRKRFEQAPWTGERENASPGHERWNSGAGHEIRTRDIQLGKLALYQLS